MTSLHSSFVGTHRPWAAEFRRKAYICNGWNAPQTWDGRASSTTGIGITGPAQTVGSWTPTPTENAGTVTAGDHKVRYRYLDVKTGYVSNPSEERTVTAAGAKTLEFPINTSGAANIIRSTDSKTTHIVLEMTVAAGSVFFEAKRTDQDDATLIVDIDDVTLAQQTLDWAEDGHDPPPIRKYIVPHRDRLWTFGNVTHSDGTVSVSASKTVTGSSSDWNTDVLGSSGSPPTDGRKFIRFGSETTLYEIDYASSATSLTLRETYSGTISGSSYEIVSKNNNVYVSRAAFPESFPPDSFLAEPQGQLAGDLTAGIGFFDAMIFFTEYSAFRVIWTSEPSTDATRRPIPGNRGALNQWCVCVVEGRLFAMDRQGFWLYEGGNPQDLTRPLKTWLDTVDFTGAEEFHCCFYPSLRAVRWYVFKSGDSQPTRYAQLDVDKLVWNTGVMDDNPITTSSLGKTSSGYQNYVGDGSGYWWLDDVGTCDGVTSTWSHLTVDSGATTTSIPTTATDIPTSNVGVDNVMAYWLEGDENQMVSANTATTLTTAAFASAPAEGDTIWLGRIPAKLKTKAFHWGLNTKSQNRYLHLYFEPLASTRHVLVRIYEDYSSTAKSWGQSSWRENIRGVQLPGKNSDYDATDFVVDLSTSEGSVRIPLGGTNARVIEVELEVIEPDTALELVGIEIDGMGSEPTT